MIARGSGRQAGGLAVTRSEVLGNVEGMLESRRTMTIAGGAVMVLCLALAGCTTAGSTSSTSPSSVGADASSAPESSASATPESSGAETVVREYLAAIAA